MFTDNQWVSTPVVWRPVAGKIAVSLPFALTNRDWLREQLGSGVPYSWDKDQKMWVMSRTHLFTIVPVLASKFGSVEVYIDFKTTVKCDKRCRDAKKNECVCQCLGDNHKGGSLLTGWFEVGETTLVARDVMRRHMRVTKSDVE